MAREQGLSPSDSAEMTLYDALVMLRASYEGARRDDQRLALVLWGITCIMNPKPKRPSDLFPELFDGPEPMNADRLRKIYQDRER